MECTIVGTFTQKSNRFAQPNRVSYSHFIRHIHSNKSSVVDGFSVAFFFSVCFSLFCSIILFFFFRFSKHGVSDASFRSRLFLKIFLPVLFVFRSYSIRFMNRMPLCIASEMLAYEHIPLHMSALFRVSAHILAYTKTCMHALELHHPSCSSIIVVHISHF